MLRDSRHNQGGEVGKSSKKVRVRERLVGWGEGTFRREKMPINHC